MKRSKEINLNLNLKDSLEKLQELQDMVFISEYYIDGDIETFEKEFYDIPSNISSIINGKTPNEKEQKKVNLYGQTKLLAEVIRTKKIMKNVEDFAVLGKMFQYMSEQCNELSKEEK